MGFSVGAYGFSNIFGPYGTEGCCALMYSVTWYPETDWSFGY